MKSSQDLTVNSAKGKADIIVQQLNKLIQRLRGETDRLEAPQAQAAFAVAAEALRRRQAAPFDRRLVGEEQLRKRGNFIKVQTFAR
jgi:Rod binding domain-containing protein